MFANPGSTEVPFLTGLPDDIRFVLGLHEGSVVGLATGLRDRHAVEPALVLLHTTAGLGTAVSALATARVNRAPLVVVVGQQDRRHSRLRAVPRREAGRASPASTRSASTSPPGHRTFRARSSGRSTPPTTWRGPALVIVPMDDWEQPADEEREPAAADGTVLRGAAPPPEAVDALAAFLADGGVTRARRRCGGGRPGDLVGAGRSSRSGSSRPSSRSRSAPRRIPAGSPAVPRRAARRPSAAARAARALRHVRRRGAGLPQAPYAPGTLYRAGNADRRRHRRRPRRGAPESGRAGRRRLARRRRAASSPAACRRTRRPRPPPEPFRPPRPRPAGARRAAFREPRARGVGRAAAARRRRRRRSAGRPARDSRTVACPRAARLPQRRNGRPRLRHACGRRRAHGPAEPTRRGRRRRRLGDLRCARRVERRPLRDRRALRRALERALRRHGSARRAPRRHRPLAGVRRGRARDDRAWLWLSCPSGSRPTTSCVASLDDVVPTLAERNEPLVLDVVVAPTLEFAP